MITIFVIIISFGVQGGYIYIHMHTHTEIYAHTHTNAHIYIYIHMESIDMPACVEKLFRLLHYYKTVLF